MSSDLAYIKLAKCAEANCSHLSARLFVILAHIRQSRPGGILMVGDSNTEATLLPRTLCGLDVINAGIGGATVGTFQRATDELMTGAKPALVILAIGSNDAWASSHTSPEVFAQQYRYLLRS